MGAERPPPLTRRTALATVLAFLVAPRARAEHVKIPDAEECTRLRTGLEWNITLVRGYEQKLREWGTEYRKIAEDAKSFLPSVRAGYERSLLWLTAMEDRKRKEESDTLIEDAYSRMLQFKNEAERALDGWTTMPDTQRFLAVAQSPEYADNIPMPPRKKKPVHNQHSTRRMHRRHHR